MPYLMVFCLARSSADSMGVCMRSIVMNAVWRGVVCVCGVVWCVCGVVWCGVKWRGVSFVLEKSLS